MNAMRETASSQFPQIVVTPNIYTEDERESQFTQQNPPARSQFPSVNRTHHDQYMAQLGVLSDRNSAQETAEFMTKRSSLLEVLSKATEPIKYSQGIDDSDNETVNSQFEDHGDGAGGISVTKILRD